MHDLGLVVFCDTVTRVTCICWEYDLRRFQPSRIILLSEPCKFSFNLLDISNLGANLWNISKELFLFREQRLSHSSLSHKVIGLLALLNKYSGWIVDPRLGAAPLSRDIRFSSSLIGAYRRSLDLASLLVGANHVINSCFSFRTPPCQPINEIFLNPRMVPGCLFAPESGPVLVCIKICSLNNWMLLEVSWWALRLVPQATLENPVTRDFRVELWPESTIVLQNI